MKKILLVIISVYFLPLYAEPLPRGWNQTNAQKYEAGLDYNVKYSGERSAYILSREDSIDSIGLVGQALGGCPHKGSYIVISGMLKTEGAERAGLFLNADLLNEKVRTTKENVYISGTQNWTSIKYYYRVPNDCVSIDVGFYLSGEGRVWADEILLKKVDVIEHEVMVKRYKRVKAVKLTNGDFETDPE